MEVAVPAAGNGRAPDTRKAVPAEWW
jgi:hypothetical protein